MPSKIVVEWFWNPLESDFEAFLEPPRDKMTGKTDRSDKVEMFKNTCVFTVRLHLRSVDNANTKLAETLFFLL